jgi:hypothetical protein
MPRYFDRYEEFRSNDKMKPIPGLTLTQTNGDKTVLYKLGETRLDKLSNTYYNSPYFGWLIMSANPQFGGLEFLIPDQTIIVVPFPFEDAIGRYIQLVNNYKLLYGEQ